MGKGASGASGAWGPVYLGVIGESDPPPHLVETAEALGRCVAEAGAVLVCGGMGGVMEAACRGARGAGGHTIGIMPGHNESESPPNSYVEFPVFTGMGSARNVMVVLSGEAAVAIDGSYGTLSEIAHALINGIPVVGLDTWDFAYHGHEADSIVRTSDPVEAAGLAISLARSRGRSQES